MNFDELIEAVKGKLYERISNPILFSFSIFLITLNWRFFYKLFLGDSVASIDEYLNLHPIDILKPAMYSIIFAISTPLLSLISEPYSELIKTITLAARNYMRKNWQEQEMATIAEIENKYIGIINSLKQKIDSERIEYSNISESLKRMFKVENSLSGDVNLRFISCETDLMIGDIAMLKDNNLAVRGTVESANSILGIVVGKAGSNYAYIIEKGIIESSLVDIREKHNISSPGTYFLSRNNLSRLELVTSNIKGNFRIIGSLDEAGSFQVALRSQSN